jgi:hypothetical protein
MTLSTGLSTTLNTDLVALANQVQSNDATTKGDQRVAELAAKVLKDINKESTLLSPISKKYIDDIKSIIEAKEWNKLPESSQINSDIELFNKISEDITFASEFVGVDINDVLSLLLEFERKNGSIQAKFRQAAGEFTFVSANKAFEAEKKANAHEFSAGIANAVAGCIGNLAGVLGGLKGLHSAKEAMGSSVKSLKLSNEISTQTGRKDLLQKKNKELLEQINDLKQKIKTEKNPNIKQDAEKKLQDIRVERLKIEEEIKSTDKDLELLTNRLNQNDQIVASQNQIAANITPLVGGVGKVCESLIQIAATFYRNDQKTEELNAKMYELSKAIGTEANQTANDAYQQARDQMRNIIQVMQQVAQDLHSSMSKQVSMS